MNNALIDTATRALNALEAVFDADVFELSCEESDAVNEARWAFESIDLPYFGKNRMIADDFEPARKALARLAAEGE